MMRNEQKNIFSFSKEEISVESVITVSSQILNHPFHTVWTIKQEDGSLSYFKIFKKIKQDGEGTYREFYRGFSIATPAAVIGIFFYLSGAACALKWFGDNQFGQAMQGPCAQMFETIISAPATRLVELEQVSIGAANHGFKKLSVLQKTNTIWQESRIRGFYRGALPLICINSVDDAFGYWLRARILNYYQTEQRKQIGPQLFATCLSFSLAYIITTPFAIAETRLRIHEAHPDLFPDKTFFPAMRTLYRQSSVRGLFRGAPIAGLYGILSSLPIACDAVYR